MQCPKDLKVSHRPSASLSKLVTTEVKQFLHVKWENYTLGLVRRNRLCKTYFIR